MRSFAELKFRARQELMDLLLAIRPPQPAAFQPAPLALPDPHATAAVLRGTEFALSIEAIADEILADKLPLLGLTIDTGQQIHWRRDYVHGMESAPIYFRRIPYLDFARAGDHKIIWELNRHQHLVLLAQAYLFTGNPAYRNEMFAQIDSWLDQNPFQRGINWASALEVAFRALSWIWIYHFAGSEMPQAFRHKFLTGLFRHGVHLAENLSIYFSPNTHLLGEAVALHALGTLFPQFPNASRWRERGLALVEQQLEFQVHADGSHFEQSSYYHVYALDLFLLCYLVAGRPERWNPVLIKMADYLDWLLGPARRITFWGDDDGGRVFHPFGDRAQFGRATLSTCGILFNREAWIGSSAEIAEQAAWWVGAACLSRSVPVHRTPAGSHVFEQGGLAFLQSGNLFLEMDCGGLGYGGAGHSHSDALSVTLRLAGDPVLIDPGTFTYVADPHERTWFRSSAAHNTVRIDESDQATQAGPFRWSAKPEVQLIAWNPDKGKIVASCRYADFLHRRTVQLHADNLTVIDEIEGPPSEHVCEQTWQLGPAATRVNFTFSHDPVWQISKFSPAYGVKTRGESLIIRFKGTLPTTLTTRITTNENTPPDR